VNCVSSGTKKLLVRTVRSSIFFGGTALGKKIFSAQMKSMAKEIKSDGVLCAEIKLKQERVKQIF
jgi:hypothetical protein